jgi:hypothetical protein
MLKYSFLYHKKDNKVRPLERSTLEFWRAMSIRRVETKDDAPLFIPATFIDTDGTRCDKNVANVTMALLDFDDGGLPFPKSLDMFDFFCFAYTTYSHTPSKPKWRFLAPLQTPITRKEWKDGGWDSCVREFGKIMGLKVPHSYIDKTCKNPSRAYYYPSAPIGKSGENARVLWNMQTADRWSFDIVKPKRKKFINKTINVRGDGYNAVDSECGENTANSADWRGTIATKLISFGGRLVDSPTGPKCVGWHCPNCDRQKTFYYIYGAGVYCSHKNSCGYSATLYELAQHYGVL